MAVSDAEAKQVNRFGVAIKLILIICFFSVLTVVGLVLLLWTVSTNADKISDFMPCLFICDEG